MKLTKKELEVINQLFNTEPQDMYFGICYNYIYIQNYMELANRNLIEDYLKELLVNCCIELGIYSGMPEIPIKHKVGASAAYRKYLLWNKKTQYGCNRWDVLNLMRKKLQEELENAKM